MGLLLMIATGKALAANPPELHAEAQLSDARPYAQQTVMLRLHVVHSPAVKELDVDPVQGPNFTLKRVAGPPRTTRLSGSQQMTSDFVYALTPLSSGTLHLPPLVVRASVENAAAPNGQLASEKISSSSEPLSIEVHPLPEHAASLLPLYALDVTLQHNARPPLKVGEPFEVSIVQHAVGTAGDRLSDATELLQGTDFSIYPGRSSTSSRMMRNGQLIEGQRIDTLTLVPRHGGHLQLPAITLPWWDIGHGSAAQAGWSGERVEVQPESNLSSIPAAGAPALNALSSGSTPVSLWPVIIGMLFAFAGGWWLRGRCATDDRGTMINRFFGFNLPLRPRWWTVAAWRHAAALGSRFSDWIRREQQFIERISARFPDPWAIAHETDNLRKDLKAAQNADALRQCLLGWGNKVLGLPVHSTLTEWGRTLAQAYPQVDSGRLHPLLATLNASLYGGTRALELEAWKRDFSTELDRMGGRKPSRPDPVRHRRLPALNPV